MLTVTAKKSTLQRIRNEFSHVIDAERESALDFGLTLGTSWKYGKFTLTDNETGEIMDYGTPAMVKYNGDTFGCIVWGERESMVDCEGVTFSTCDESLDYCFPIPSAKAVARYSKVSAISNECESDSSDNRNESESENETIETVSQEGSLTDEFHPIVNESKQECIMTTYTITATDNGTDFFPIGVYADIDALFIEMRLRFTLNKGECRKLIKSGIFDTGLTVLHCTEDTPANNESSQERIMQATNSTVTISDGDMIYPKTVLTLDESLRFDLFNAYDMSDEEFNQLMSGQTVVIGEYTFTPKIVAI